MPNERLILIVKIAVLATWLLAAAAFLLPSSSTLGSLGRILFLLLLGIHVVECLVFSSALKRTGRPLGTEILQTLLFGVIHYGEVKTLLAARAAEEAAITTSQSSG